MSEICRLVSEVLCLKSEVLCLKSEVLCLKSEVLCLKSEVLCLKSEVSSLLSYLSSLISPLSSLLSPLLSLLSLLSCVCLAQPALQRFEYTHPQMGTVFRVAFYAKDSAAAEAAITVLFARVDTLNAVLSDYLPESETNRLCARAGTGEKVRVSADLWHILRQSDRYSRQTDGAFDVTIGNLSRLWRRARHLKTLPDTARVIAAQQLTDYRNIRYYRRGHRVQLLKKGIQLDFGGIAQGYAADECLRLLRTFGIYRALADAGGDIALGDPPPDAAGWRVEIPTIDSSKTVLSLSNCGITTSGAQYRYLEANGLRYSHIIDPRTGWGLTHRVLVTVQAPSGIEADAWATALSVADNSAVLRSKGGKWRVWRMTSGTGMN